MREILFRGKSVHTGKWLAGDLLRNYFDADDRCIYVDHEDNIPGYNEFALSGAEQVVPESVGQYTDLTDKNGTKIFEGDFIKTRHGVRYIAFKEGCFVAKKPHSKICANMRDYMREIEGACEVIGNIHDNPELMDWEG